MMMGLLYAMLVLALLAAVLLVVAARRPDIFVVSRTTTIAAPPERIFPLIDDLQQMARWTPYSLRDPAMAQRFDGPPRGVGAVHHFAGKKSGTGFLKIVESQPPQRVAINLVMTKPLTCDNAVTFTLAPRGAETDVTWEMAGPAPLWAKAIQTLVDMDKMVGRDFAEGLANLKRLVETGRS